MATGDAEYAVFPMAVMNITTKMGVGTHVGSFAIDIAGSDKGKDWAFAPFTGTIKRKYPNGNTVWIESNSPVQLADGTTDYLTVAMTHDNNIDRLKVGQVINQGVNFYQEGTAGNATGNHIHLNVGRGKFTGTGWYKNKYGYWVINNEIPPYDAFYLSGTEVINGGGYPWKTIGDNMEKVDKELAEILSFGIVGRNGLSGRTNGLNDTGRIEGLIGRDLNGALIRELFYSEEAKKWRDSNEYGSNPDIQKRLDSSDNSEEYVEVLAAGQKMYTRAIK